jgi:hypothetical protein
MPRSRIDNLNFRSISLGERWAITSIHWMLWPLTPDERISVLMSMFAANLLEAVNNEDELDFVIEALRLQLKLKLNAESDDAAVHGRERPDDQVSAWLH